MRSHVCRQDTCEDNTCIDTCVDTCVHRPVYTHVGMCIDVAVRQIQVPQVVIVPPFEDSDASLNASLHPAVGLAGLAEYDEHEAHLSV